MSFVTGTAVSNFLHDVLNPDETISFDNLYDRITSYISLFRIIYTTANIRSYSREDIRRMASELDLDDMLETNVFDIYGAGRIIEKCLEELGRALHYGYPNYDLETADNFVMYRFNRLYNPSMAIYAPDPREETQNPRGGKHKTRKGRKGRKPKKSKKSRKTRRK
jgi:hypothetical protein